MAFPQDSHPEAEESCSASCSDAPPAGDGSSTHGSSSRGPELRQGLRVELDCVTIRAGQCVLLQEATASFEPGQVTLVIGPSGAGKTTLLRLLAGLLDDDQSGLGGAGVVRLAGEEASPAVRRRHVGIVFQSHALFDELSPLANVQLAAAHRRSHDPVPASLQPEQLVEELGIPRHVRTVALSGGQRQRLALARTLAYDPDVLLYDEPTTGLDTATATSVATLIRATHASHPKTSIVVTHDYEVLTPIADRIYLLDPETRTLREVDRAHWSELPRLLKPVHEREPEVSARSLAAQIARTLRRWGGETADLLAGTTRTVEYVVGSAVSLFPAWTRPRWGFRFLGHYLRLVAGPSAFVYLAVSGLIIGFVTTYFTFRFLPYARYTEPLLIEDLLMSMGFALYRILVPVLATILIAARCGAAVTSDVGGKSYGRQLDALRTMGVSPRFYLQTPILYSFLLGTPLLTWVSYQVAAAASLVVFTATHPERGPDFWQLYFHQRLSVPATLLYAGSYWLLAKLLICALGIALIAYRSGASPKYSGRDVSGAITSSILWSTLWVLSVHFAFAFCEFE